MTTERKTEKVGGAPEPCFAGGCRSPGACNDWGYCRERNQGRAPSSELQAIYRSAAEAARKKAAKSGPHEPDPSLAGKFYWPSDDFSTPADNLCWHVPEEPNRDFRCIRPLGHPGKHQHEWSPTIKGHSHKATHPPSQGGLTR